MTINFFVNNQSIKRTDNNSVVASSVNYLYARFTFSDEWEGVKTAVFKKDGEVYNQILDDDNKCIIPWECLSEGVLEVSVFCGNRITAGTAYVNIEKTGYALGKESEEPTPDVYTELIAAVNKAMERNSVRYSTEEREIGYWVDGKPLFQRTYLLTLPLVNDESIIENIEFDMVVSLNGIVMINHEEDSYTETIFIADGYRKSNSNDIRFTYVSTETPSEEEPNSVYCDAGSVYQGQRAVITIQYTKRGDRAVD